MATTHRPESPLDRPGALIASLPALLGFVPERSLVFVTAADGWLGAVVRADLQEALETSAERLITLAGTSGAQIVIAVIIDDEGPDCAMCADQYRDLAHDMAEGLAEHGIELVATHVVAEVAAGARWHCADGCGADGLIDDPGATPLAAAAVLDGRRLYRKRADLVEAVAVRDPAAAAALGAVADRTARPARNRPDAAVRADVEHALQCSDRFSRGVPLADDDAARLARSLTDVRVRDTLCALAVGEHAARAEELWSELARRLPERWRADALVLLAFFAYVRGDGPLAGVAVNAALDGEPEHRLGGMLDRALQAGLPPDQISRLARSGFRLARQLGVALPPRRTVGRRVG
jgi:hypothetical protein